MLLPEQEKENRTVAIDFDGVLAHHEPDWPVTKIGPPIPQGFKLAKKLRAHGYRVCILTARPPELHPHIALWLHKHGFIPDAVTNVKPPAVAYIDDRAIPFPKNGGLSETTEHGVKGMKWRIRKKREDKPRGHGLGSKSYYDWFDYGHQELEKLQDSGDFTADTGAAEISEMLSDFPKNVVHGLIRDLGRDTDSFFDKLSGELEKEGYRKDDQGFFVTKRLDPEKLKKAQG